MTIFCRKDLGVTFIAINFKKHRWNELAKRKVWEMKAVKLSSFLFGEDKGVAFNAV